MSELNAGFNHKILMCKNESSLLKEEIHILNANWKKNLEMPSKLLDLLEAEKENHLSSNKTFDFINNSAF